ncbi:MAG: serine/threonine-protein kinase [Myxococcota bacterium]
MKMRPRRRATLVQTFGEGSLSESIPVFVDPSPEDVDVLPKEGDVVGGHYRLIRRLGEGMFGRVFVAERLDVPEHRVALKVLRADVYAGRNVQRELVMLAATAHPHVVQLKDHGQCARFVWLTMPLFEGRTLEARLEEGPLGLREAYDVFTPICRGVHALHARGLRHQDIKPDNIFLARLEGQLHPVLLDLGVAVEQHADFVAGTALYAAPEQLMALGGGREREDGRPPVLSAKMDTYALAATLLRSIVGPTYYPGEHAESPFDIADAFRQRERAPLPPGSREELTGPARAHIAAAFSRWLAQDPQARPSADAMVGELDVLLEPERDAAAAIERTLDRERRAFRRTRRALVGLVGVTAVGAVVGLWHRETLRLAGALRHAEAEGRASFDQLDTCVAAHALAADETATCRADRARDAATHRDALARHEATSRATEEAFSRRLATVNGRFQGCRADGRAARDAFQTERELLVAERVAAEEHRARTEDRARRLEAELADGRAAHEAALAAADREREVLREERDAARRAHIAAEAEVARIASERDDLARRLAPGRPPTTAPDPAATDPAAPEPEAPEASPALAPPPELGADAEAPARAATDLDP